MRRHAHIVVSILLAALSVSCATQEAGRAKTKAGEPRWFGVHTFLSDRNAIPMLKRMISESFAPSGVNVLIVEVNYRFAFESHPELTMGDAPVTKADAQELAALCRSHGIRLIPQFNCLGHQSWGNKGNTFSLLVKHPEFDETPQIPASNEGIYCRSWCPLHPDVNGIVFALMDELIDAFQADAFHVGMDEVFLIADSQCPRCKGKSPAEVFAKAVNDYHKHLVEEKNLTMLMWGDRLLDQAATGYNMFESSRNGTAPAIDLIPKDIVICDWHYGKRPEYPSVPYFQEKGFRVWPSGWDREDATLAFLKYSRSVATPKMLGHLCTTWSSVNDLGSALLNEGDTSKLSRSVLGVAAAFRACAREFNK